MSVVLPAPEGMQAGVRVAPYVHGSAGDLPAGRMGTLALTYIKSPKLKQVFVEEAFQSDLAKLERSLARQIVGFDTRSIRFVKESPEAALYEWPLAPFLKISVGSL